MQETEELRAERENKQRTRAYLTALETVLLHPLITKSGTKQEQNKESETKDSKSRLANSAIMQLVQQHARYGRIASRKEKPNTTKHT